MVWTHVNDGLPDSDTTVMTYEPDSCEPIWPGYHDGQGWCDMSTGLPMEGVTHWMDFPEPPTT